VKQLQIGFIDFSREERNKVLATLRMLGTQTALDELGIGVIRDAYADIMFPGISTIQTRAKYFVLIPYLFSKAANQNFSSGNELYRWLIANEDGLVEILVRNSGAEATGIIGKNALKQKRVVKMKPSSIYWNGLRTFEIVRNPGLSLKSACDITWRSAQNKKVLQPKVDGETFDDRSAGSGHAVLFSPIQPDYDFMKESAMSLTLKEAEYLEGRILKSSATQNTLMAFLIKNRINCDQFEDIPSAILPPEIKSDFLLARDFSQFIVGAHIRYNVIFSNGNDKKMNESFEKWLLEIRQNPIDLSRVLGRIKSNNHTSKFCKDFFESAISNDLKRMDELIIAREKAVKSDRSKLCKPSEYQYDHNRPIHFYKLDYRFGTAKNIIEDIIAGLEK
jgi:hypothetical protein